MFICIICSTFYRVFCFVLYLNNYSSLTRILFCHHAISQCVIFLRGIRAEWNNSAILLATAGYLSSSNNNSPTSSSTPPSSPAPTTSSNTSPTASSHTTPSADRTKAPPVSSSTNANSPDIKDGKSSSGGGVVPLYRNAVRFYTRKGSLRYTYHLPPTAVSEP